MEALAALAEVVRMLVVVGIWAVPVAGLANILHKAGYSRSWLLVAVVPVVNVVMFLVFAFGDWPVHRELRAEREARARLRSPGSPEE